MPRDVNKRIKCWINYLINQLWIAIINYYKLILYYKLWSIVLGTNYMLNFFLRELYDEFE
jgi:hypothetical protein